MEKRRCKDRLEILGGEMLSVEKRSISNTSIYKQCYDVFIRISDRVNCQDNGGSPNNRRHEIQARQLEAALAIISASKMQNIRQEHGPSVEQCIEIATSVFFNSSSDNRGCKGGIHLDLALGLCLSLTELKRTSLTTIARWRAVHKVERIIDMLKNDVLSPDTFYFFVLPVLLASMHSHMAKSLRKHSAECEKLEKVLPSDDPPETTSADEYYVTDVKRIEIPSMNELLEECGLPRNDLLPSFRAMFDLPERTMELVRA